MIGHCADHFTFRNGGFQLACERGLRADGGRIRLECSDLILGVSDAYAGKIGMGSQFRQLGTRYREGEIRFQSKCGNIERSIVLKAPVEKLCGICEAGGAAGVALRVSEKHGDELHAVLLCGGNEAAARLIRIAGFYAGRIPVFEALIARLGIKQLVGVAELVTVGILVRGRHFIV